MLSNTLVTNEIKNYGGVEVEFERLSIGDRSTEFMQKNELPARPYRMTISHTESGTGLNRRRRSLIRFDQTGPGQVDTTLSRRNSCYIVLDTQVGQATDTSMEKDLIANVMSFVASLGASTTILYDGTGNGAVALLTGGL